MSVSYNQHEWILVCTRQFIDLIMISVSKGNQTQKDMKLFVKKSGLIRFITKIYVFRKLEKGNF